MSRQRFRLVQWEREPRRIWRLVDGEVETRYFIMHTESRRSSTPYVVLWRFGPSDDFTERIHPTQFQMLRDAKRAAVEMYSAPKTD